MEDVLGVVVMHVADFLNVVIARSDCRFLFGEHSFGFRERPGEIVAVVIHGKIGVLRSVKAAVGAVAEPFIHPADDVAGDGREEHVARHLIGVHIVLQQLRIVVAHFLEVGDDPALIDRVAMEAACQLIVDPAVRHLLKCVDENRSQRLVICAVIGRGAISPVHILIHHQVECCGMRKLGRAAEPAVHFVEHFSRRFKNCIDHRRGDCPAACGKRLSSRDGALDQLRLFDHVGIFLAIGSGD